MSAQIFISYRRSRKAEVLAAKTALEAAGVDVWLDLEDIDPLADFPDRIRAGIDASHAMLVWWSSDYAESDICLQELRRAWQHARRHSSDVARRVWVLNPEAGDQHIFAGGLNHSNFLAPPPAGGEALWAERLRERLDALLPEGPLAERGGRLLHQYVHRVFWRLSREIGLRRVGEHTGPRIHDLRHRFAIRTLLGWYRDELEVEQRLPLLSTYLGHTCVRDTYWYLSACPQLMEEAARRLDRQWEAKS